MRREKKYHKFYPLLDSLIKLMLSYLNIITNAGAFASNSSLIHFSTVQIQIEEITRKLKTGDLGVSAVPEERFGIKLTIQSLCAKQFNQIINFL